MTRGSMKRRRRNPKTDADGEEGEALLDAERNPRELKKLSATRLPTKDISGGVVPASVPLTIPEEVKQRMADEARVIGDSDSDVEEDSDSDEDGAGAGAGAGKSDDAADDDDDDNDDDDATADAGPSRSAGGSGLLKTLTPVERAKLKLEMAELCEQVIERPEKTLAGASSGNPLKRLHLLASDCADPVVVRLAIVSQLCLFRDIAPDFRIRLPSAKELAVKVTKDVRRRREYEKTLVLGYRRFVNFLDREASVSSDPDVVLTAVKTQCQLLRALPDFNFRSDLVLSLVRKMSAPDPIGPIACEAMQDLFRSDVSPSASLDAVHAIGKAVRAKGVKTKPAVIRTLLALPIRTAAVSDVKVMKKRLRDGVIPGGDWEDTEAKRTVNHAVALKDMLHVFFRLLRSPGNDRVMAPILAGLAKFAHLVDVGVVLDLISTFRDIIKRDDLPVDAGLSCVLTVFRILNGNGKVLNADDDAFATFLLNCIPGLARPDGGAHTGLALNCVELLLFRRRELAVSRVAAFVQRLTSVAPHLAPHQSLAVLSTVRGLLQRYPTVQQVLDPDSERAVAGASETVWGLTLLQRHFHPTVKASTAAVLDAKPPLPSEAYREVLKTFDPSDGSFNPPMKTPITHGGAPPGSKRDKRKSRKRRQDIRAVAASTLRPELADL